MSKWNIKLVDAQPNNNKSFDWTIYRLDSRKNDFRKSCYPDRFKKYQKHHAAYFNFFFVLRPKKGDMEQIAG